MAYSHTIYVNVGSAEVALDVSYTVTPGFAGDRVDPPYSAEAEVSKVEAVIEVWRFGKKTTERKQVEGWLFDLIASDAEINADLLNEAGEEDDYRADDAAEMRREDLRMHAAE